MTAAAGFWIGVALVISTAIVVTFLNAKAAVIWPSVPPFPAELACGAGADARFDSTEGRWICVG